MDLNFVTERILSLSFPSDVEAMDYRQALQQAASMLQTKHGDNYMVLTFSPLFSSSSLISYYIENDLY